MTPKEQKEAYLPAKRCSENRPLGTLPCRMGRAPKRARSGWRARYEPWHDGQLQLLISKGKRHIV